jgi:hypothetical protein
MTNQDSDKSPQNIDPPKYQKPGGFPKGVKSSPTQGGAQKKKFGYGPSGGGSKGVHPQRQAERLVKDRS